MYLLILDFIWIWPTSSSLYFGTVRFTGIRKCKGGHLGSVKTPFGLEDGPLLILKDSIVSFSDVHVKVSSQQGRSRTYVWLRSLALLYYWWQSLARKAFSSFVKKAFSPACIHSGWTIAINSIRIVHCHFKGCQTETVKLVSRLWQTSFWYTGWHDFGPVYCRFMGN